MIKIRFHNKKNISLTLLYKFAIVFINIYSFKLFNKTLEGDFFSIFLVFNQLFIIFSLFEFGFNYALQNLLVNNRRKWKEIFFYCFKKHLKKVSYLFPIVISLTYINYDFINQYLNYHLTFYELFLIIFLFIIFYLLNVSYRVFYSFGKSYQSSLLIFISQLLGYISCFFYLNVSENYELFIFVLFFYIPQMLINLIVYMYFLSKIYKSKLRVLDIDIINRFNALSSKFNILLISSLIIVQIDLLILNFSIDSKSLIWYAFLSKLFTAVTLIYTLAYSSLWPYFSSLNIQDNLNNFIKVKKIIYYIFSFSFLFITILTINIFLFKNNIFKYFFNDISPNNFDYVLICFYIYHVIILWVHGFGTAIQSSTDRLSGFVTLTIFQIILSLIFQIVFTYYFGIYGPIIGMTLSFILTMAWYLPIQFFKINFKNAN